MVTGRSRSAAKMPSPTATTYSTISSLVIPTSGKYTLSGLVTLTVRSPTWSSTAGTGMGTTLVTSLLERAEE